MQRNIVHGCLGLALLTLVASAQSPFEFAKPSIPQFAVADTSRVFAANLFGSAHEECLSMNGGLLDVVDFHTGGAPLHVGFTVAGNVNYVAFADFNGDGNRDFAALASNSSGPTVHVALAAGGGTFAQSFSSTSFLPIHAADLDGDGDIDLVVGGQRWLNNGSGAFGAPINFNIGGAVPIDVAPGDVDGDGDQDLVATLIGSSSSGPGLTARIHRQNVNHSFSLLSATLLVANAVNAVTTVEDLNADGKADLAFAALDGAPTFNQAANMVVGSAVGQSPISFVVRPHLTMTSMMLPFALTTADLDGDGLTDVVVPAVSGVDGNYRYQTLTAFMMTLNGALVSATGSSFAKTFTRTISSDVVGTAACDDDLDGRRDLLIGPPDGIVVVYRNIVGAAPVTAMVDESIGPDLVLTSLAESQLTIVIVNAQTFEPLVGHLVTLTAPLPGGGTFTTTQTMNLRTTFDIAPSVAAQNFTATISSSLGTSQTFTVHPTASITNVTGANQAVPVDDPFPNPVTATIIDGNGQPLVGVTTRYFGSVSYPALPRVYSDASGGVSFALTAGPSAGTQYERISIADDKIFTYVTLTSIGGTLQIDTPLVQSACTNQPITISGHVFRSSGAPHSGVLVSLQLLLDGTYPPTTTAADGSFSFVVSSSFTTSQAYIVRCLAASPSSVTGQLYVGAFTRVILDTGMSQSVCTAGPLLPITGHLEIACGPVPSNVAVFASATGPMALTFQANPVTTDANGNFSFQPILSSLPTAAAQNTVIFSILGQSTTPAGTQIKYAPYLPLIVDGDDQIGYAGQTYAKPLKIKVQSSCYSVQGVPVTFTTTSPFAQVAPGTVTTDALGEASTVVTTTTASAGPFTVTATVAGSSVTFDLFQRRLASTTTPTTLSFVYRHEHPNVPLVFAVDLPGQTPITTPWGSIVTSILSPGPYFAALDGLGLFGSIDPGMTTPTIGVWTLTVALPPTLGLSFVAQIYGYDGNAAFPADYIVSNPVMFDL